MKKLHYLFLGLTLSLGLFTSCENEILEGEFAASDDGTFAGNCENALLTFGELTMEFQSATEANFEVACNEYRQSIQGILMTCEGDLEESFVNLLNQTIESLGDCTVSMDSACDVAQMNSTTAAAEFANATDEDQEALCESYTTVLQAEITACGDPDGSIQNTINNLPCSGCGQAQENATEAQIAFEGADPLNEAEYEALCGNYSFALQEQIIACGDPDGSLMAIVTDLGDCTPPEEDGPVRLLLEGQMKNFNTADVTINGSTLSVVATDLDTADTFTFDVVLQQTGMNITQNLELTVDGVVHTPFMGGDTPFSSNITENTGSVIVGTFTGSVQNPDGDLVTTASGVIDIEF